MGVMQIFPFKFNSGECLHVNLHHWPAANAFTVLTLEGKGEAIVAYVLHQQVILNLPVSEVFAPQK